MNAVHNADALTWNEGKTMQVTFDPNSLDDYRRFLAVKSLPKFDYQIGVKVRIRRLHSMLRGGCSTTSALRGWLCANSDSPRQGAGLEAGPDRDAGAERPDRVRQPRGLPRPFPTVNSFLARFFVNRGQTDNRWELKPHALRPFYRALSHWSHLPHQPGDLRLEGQRGTIPPIHVHIHDVDLTARSGAVRRRRAAVRRRPAASRRGRSWRRSPRAHNGGDIETLKPRSSATWSSRGRTNRRSSGAATTRAGPLEGRSRTRRASPATRRIRGAASG
jgi:hypothetical protein